MTIKIEPLLNRDSPKKGESLTGFFLRLAELNHLTKVTELAELIGIRDSMKNKVNPSTYFREPQIYLLSQLSLVSEEELYKTTVHRYAGKLAPGVPVKAGLNELSDSEIESFASIRWTKFCPQCLREEIYHRLHWDIRPITQCLKHKEILMDRCAVCGQRVMTKHVSCGRCQCGAELSSQTPGGDYIPDHSHQELIYGLLDMGIGQQLNELPFTLPSSLFFKLLNITFSTFYEAYCQDDADAKISVADANLSKNIMNNVTRDTVIANFVRSLTDWPNQFYSFLQMYQNVGKYSNRETGLGKDFSSIQRLLIILKEPEFAFIHKAFEDFLLYDWDGLLRNSSRYFKDNPDRVNESLNVSLGQASSMLGVGYRIIIRLLESGTLDGKVIGSAENRVYLVRRASVEHLKKSWSCYVSFIDAAKELGTNIEGISELIKAGLLQDEPIPDTGVRIIKRDELSRFKEDLFRCIPAPKASQEHFVNIGNACELLGFEVWGLPKIIHLIQLGVLKPYYLKGKGIKGLRFLEEEINEYAQYVSRAQYERSWRNRGKELLLTPSWISSCLGISELTIDLWCETGLMKYTTIDTSSGPAKRILAEEFITFRETFVLAAEAANIAGVEEATIYRWIRLGRLTPISGSGVDNARRHLLRRSDVERFSKENRLSINDVAKLFSCSARQIEAHIAAGRIKPVSGPGVDTFKQSMFLKSDVETLRQELADIITLPELAHTLGLSDQRLRELVKKGVFTPTSGPAIDGTQEYHFSLQSVEPYLRLYTGPEAASILGVKEVTVRKWTRTGKVKAVKGPTIDGEKYYKYRLIDIQSVDTNAVKSITVAESADKLGISKQEVWKMIMEGIIKPLRGPGIDDLPYYVFSPDTIERMKNRRSENVISAREAAKILGVDLSWFYKKWVKTGRLKTVDFKDKLGQHYFNEADVNALSKLKKSTITGPEAASMLGVQRTTIIKWTKAGKITPVSGPGIDGFGCFLYQIAEIKKIKKTGVANKNLGFSTSI